MAESRDHLTDPLIVALRYIERPTMGLNNEDPEQFAPDGATERNARLALATCIRTAREALDSAGVTVGRPARVGPEPSVPSDSEGNRG